MTRLICQDNPDILTLEATVVRSRPGAVLLSRHPFYPGGGGQLPDQGVIRWQGGETPVTGFCEQGGAVWIEVAGGVEIRDDVQLQVDPVFRQRMRELHTDLHILNALVFRDFDGALVTGVQMNDDGTARIDFDLPDADNDRLRALEPELNDLVAQDLAVATSYVSMTAAHAEQGLLRSRSVAPPPSPEGLIRVVEIAGLDRQACGGTHLASTGTSRPIRILKIENKGRSNRRVRIGLQGL
ncbi:alanyl-tRNA editing protein [Variovorax sp. J22P271]|uniref:alanyl-tRNA editing protein n=1 Tax=Variovorax davisae TaxID=3053515 RepID=UPI002576DFCB|nr:alanyl-tRNA editing protein [Variovorax sp. J22P271]MDM0035923.1 alanyl-tRNA editing protein [Variovorax sp. J22P271]